MHIPSTYFDFKRTGYRDEYFSAIGRALVVATRFEANCRSIAALVELKYPKAGPGARQALLTEDGLKWLSERLEVWQLNNYIQKAVARLQMGADVETRLQAARTARNTLVHDFAIGFNEGITESDDDDEMLFSLKELVKVIALGDLLVCLYIDSDTNEHLPNQQYVDTYVELVTRWVCEINEREP